MLTSKGDALSCWILHLTQLVLICYIVADAAVHAVELQMPFLLAYAALEPYQTCCRLLCQVVNQTNCSLALPAKLHCLDVC